MENVAVRALVAGVVQGVGFRAWTRREAQSLGLAGWVRNLEDGRVEVLVEGPGGAVQALLERLERGPASAEVERVQRHPARFHGLEGFTQRENGAAPLDLG